MGVIRFNCTTKCPQAVRLIVEVAEFDLNGIFPRHKIDREGRYFMPLMWSARRHSGEIILGPWS